MTSYNDINNTKAVYSNISLEDIESLNSDNENDDDSIESLNNSSSIKRSAPIDIPTAQSNIIHNWCSNSTPKYNNSHLFNHFANNTPNESLGKNEKNKIEEEFVILEDKEIKNTDDKLNKEDVFKSMKDMMAFSFYMFKSTFSVFGGAGDNVSL